MKERLKKSFFPVAVVALALVAVSALLLFMNGETLDLFFHLERTMDRAAALRQRFLDYGWSAPFLYILLQVAQVVLAPIPGEATGALGGYFFGGWLGTLYSTIALTVGSWLAFFIGRVIGSFFPERLKGSGVYRDFNSLACEKDYLIPFLLFLFPGFPKDSLSYLLGMSRMPIKPFLFVAAVGRLPGTLLLSFQGAQVYARNYLEFALLLLLAAAVTIPCLFYRHRVLAWLNRRGKTVGEEGVQ